MTERETFESLLRTYPHDYLTHKVFADYLDEHGQPEEAARHRAYEDAHKWLVAFTENLGYTYEYDEDDSPTSGEKIDYDILMRAADRLIETWEWNGDINYGYGDRFLQRGSSTAQSEMSGVNAVTFWSNWQIVTGRQLPDEHIKRASVFGCSC